MAKQIIELDTGHVFVGEVARAAGRINITQCYQIGISGTDSGLGQLATSGPLPNTVLYQFPNVNLPDSREVYVMNIDLAAWSSIYTP